MKEPHHYKRKLIHNKNYLILKLENFLLDFVKANIIIN